MSKFIDSDVKAARFLAFLQRRPRLKSKLEDIYWNAILPVSEMSQELRLNVKHEDIEAVKTSLVDRLNRIWEELTPLLKLAFKIFLTLAPLFELQQETKSLKDSKSKDFKRAKNIHSLNISFTDLYYEQVDEIINNWHNEETIKEAKEKRKQDALREKQEKQEARRLKAEAAASKKRKVPADVPPQLPVDEPVPTEKDA